jgi:hypothetical protein
MGCLSMNNPIEPTAQALEATPEPKLVWSKPELEILDLNEALAGGKRFASDHSSYSATS